ncbi:hypothetical protein [Komagataeibacter xylinus]|nr:hypothetical protein [Komagataeibacter xylinus]
MHIRSRTGIKAVVEQARCIFLRKIGVDVEPIELRPMPHRQIA